jgi:Skp family chaperone for outer membrane proteins
MKMTYKTAAAAAALTIGAMVLPQVAMAQSTLTVDVATLYRDSVAAKSGSSQIEAKYGDRAKTLQTNLQTAYKAFNDEVANAKKQLKPDGTLPPAEQEAFEKARKNAADAQQALDDLRQELNDVNQYVQYQIFDKVGPIAEKVRKDRKAETVVPRNVVLAFDPTADITATVLQQLNATLTTVSITPPQPQQAPAQGAQAAPANPPKQQPQSR